MLHFFDLTPEQAEDYRRAYLVELPQLVERLRQRLIRTGGPAMDESVDSLTSLGAWFVAQLEDDVDADGLSGTPGWWDAPSSEAVPIPAHARGRLLTDGELRLIDEVGAYFATVLVGAVPTAEWIVLHDKRHKNNAAENQTVLKMPDRKVVNPVSFVYGVAVGQVLYQRPPEPDVMYDYARTYAADV